MKQRHLVEGQQKTHNLPSPAWGPVGECVVVVAWQCAEVHWVSHAIVGLIVANAALIVLQTVRLWDKPRHGGQLQGTSHTPDLHRNGSQNNGGLQTKCCGGLMSSLVYLCSPAKHIQW